MMFRSLESLKQFDMSRVSQGLQDIDLLNHLSLRALLFDEVTICRLDCNQFSSQPVQAKMHLTKCSSTKNPANFVKLNPGLWHLLVTLKTVPYYFTKQSNFLYLRGD